jgi:hypothetical protein
MDEARQKLIASMGGKKAHETGRAHQWNSTTAKVAGSKGGRASANKRAALRKAAMEAAVAITATTTTTNEEVSF